jgi:hypothetical protein
MAKKLYQVLASICQARLNCLASKNGEWEARHENKLCALVKHYLPHGAGFDNGTKFDFDRSTGEKLVFTTAYHHMNEAGMYDGWTEHTVIITASLISGFDVRVTGRNRNEIKDYIASAFHVDLDADVKPEDE